MIGKTNAAPSTGPTLSEMVVSIENQTTFDAIFRFVNLNGVNDSAVIRRFLTMEIDADLTQSTTLEMNPGASCAVDYIIAGNTLYITAYELE